MDENAAVFSTVVSLIGIYFVLLVYARIQDKKDLVKWGATPLADNLPTDEYHYLFTVNTGIRKRAGTSSKVVY